MSKLRPVRSSNRAGVLQRKCACSGSSASGAECEECSVKKRLGLQAKLTVSQPGDVYEQEADRVADEVMRSPTPTAVHGAPARIQRVASHTGRNNPSAPSSAAQIQAGPARPLEPVLRQDMEQRFGYDFSQVRLHFGGAAEQSARDVNADAYTLGHDIVFGAGQFAPHTGTGRRLIAHELTHVVQQSGGVVARNAVLQRKPPSHQNETQAQYEQKVKQGTWCRDSEKTGALHDPNQQCYRELVKKFDEEAGQVCFDKKTGKFADSSPDWVSAVSGINKDGTCDIPLGLFDPPNPFTKRGQRALGHGIADVCGEDPGMCGKYFGRVAGVAMGIALPKGDANFLGQIAVPLVLGQLGGWLGSKQLPKLDKFFRGHGLTPTLSLGFGTNLGLSLGTGFEKRDRPLPLVPINTYLTFSLDSTLAARGDDSFLAKVGVRIDPGKQGGIFALSSLGAGIATGGTDVSGAASVDVGVGFRARDFLDVQIVHETLVGGESGGGGTWWLTLKLAAPKRILEEHKK